MYGERHALTARRTGFQSVAEAPPETRQHVPLGVRHSAKAEDGRIRPACVGEAAQGGALVRAGMVQRLDHHMRDGERGERDEHIPFRFRDVT